MLAELQGMVKTLEDLLSSAADPALVRTTDAVGIVESAAAIEQRAAAIKTLYAKRASESQVWANNGHRSPEDWLAKTTGSSYGQAAGTLHASEKLGALPGLEKGRTARPAVGPPAQRAGFGGDVMRAPRGSPSPPPTCSGRTRPSGRGPCGRTSS